MRSKVLLILLPLLLLLVCVSAAASEPETGAAEQEDGVSSEELHEELERQSRSLDLTAWQEYFAELGSIGIKDVMSARELLLSYAENGAADPPQSILGIVKALILNALLKERGAIAVLTAAGLMTGAACAMPYRGLRTVTEYLLGALPAILVSASFSMLCSAAKECIEKTAGFTEAALPVMTLLLSAVGATASAGALRPLMLFISGSVMTIINRLVLPLIFAGGVVGILDGLGDNGRFSGLLRLIQSAVKWIMGIAAVLYTGVCAVQGMTTAAADGVSIRTAKYALDRLLPSTGGLIGGSVDTFMSCALLLKNGVGTAAIVIMLGLLARPLVKLCAGMFVFRVSAALCRPAAHSASALLTNAADMTAYLVGAAAVVGTMFTVTVLVFVTAGGLSAGLW